MEHKVNFITRTTPSSSALLETSEAIIRESIIPALTSRTEPLPIEREFFSLPLKSRGLRIDCPEHHHDDYELSKKLSEPLEDKDPLTAELWQKRTLDDLLNPKKKKIAEKISNIKSVLSTEQTYALEIASEKGASAWLNVLPLKRYGFQLSKSEFRDGLSLRYSWNPKNAPLNCPCGEIFSLTHALHCPKGGYTIDRHDEIRDTFVNLMSEVCRDVAVEPLLQPLDGEIFDRNSTATDDARLDIKANGLWGTVFERTFFDVKIVNPLATSYPKTIRDKYHEEIKKLKHEQRIRDVENSTFNSLVFSSAGGAGPLASKVMKRQAQKISEKREEKYSDVISFIRTKISFALLKSSILCIRGCRAPKSTYSIENAISCILAEGQID